LRVQAWPGLRAPNLMFPAAALQPVQERVDTGTVFCPVVVASQGSSLNHSA